MNRFRKKRLFILVIAMLWHSLTMFSAGPASADDYDGKRTCRNESSQEFVVLSHDLPVLIEVKRTEPVSKPTGNHSIQSSSIVRIYGSVFFEDPDANKSSFETFVPPVKRGYWLLYRSLLL